MRRLYLALYFRKTTGNPGHSGLAFYGHSIVIVRMPWNSNSGIEWGPREPQATNHRCPSWLSYEHKSLIIQILRSKPVCSARPRIRCKGGVWGGGYATNLGSKFVPDSLSYIFLPRAAAIFLQSAIIFLKAVGVKAWKASLRAFSGSGCTSTLMPAPPAAPPP